MRWTCWRRGDHRCLAVRVLCERRCRRADREERGAQDDSQPAPAVGGVECVNGLCLAFVMTVSSFRLCRRLDHDVCFAPLER